MPWRVHKTTFFCVITSLFPSVKNHLLKFPDSGGPFPEVTIFFQRFRFWLGFGPAAKPAPPPCHAVYLILPKWIPDLVAVISGLFLPGLRISTRSRFTKLSVEYSSEVQVENGHHFGAC